MAMRIQGLERRLMPIGKIRLGDQTETKNGKKRPRVLDKPRLTSSNAFLLHEAAKLYGGEVRAWEDAPPGPRQWELYVQVDAIPIIIPPMDTLMQCYECWSAKGCLRRCDNRTIQYALEPAEVGTACTCPADPEQRQALANEGKACKLTTRISCMLPDLPGIGLWLIETHSYYASLWTAGMVEMLEAFAKQGRVCEAMLRIERQTRKGKHGLRHFAIPVILPQQMTPRQLFAPQMQAALLPPVDESVKSLPEHIGDLYGDTPTGTPPSAQSRTIAPAPTPEPSQTPESPTGDSEGSQDDIEVLQQRQRLMVEISRIHADHNLDHIWINRYWDKMCRRFQQASASDLTFVQLDGLKREVQAYYAKLDNRTPPPLPEGEAIDPETGEVLGEQGQEAFNYTANAELDREVAARGEA